MNVDKTDLETIKKIAKSKLDIELNINRGKDGNIVTHPIFEDEICIFPGSDGRSNICVLAEGVSKTKNNAASNDLNNLFNHIDYPEGLKVAKEYKSAMLEQANSPIEVLLQIGKSYRFTFLNLVKDYLSCDDFSAMVGYIWTNGGNKSCYNQPSKEELVKIFQACNPKVLMDEEGYEHYQNLEDEITIYRCIIEFGDEKDVYGLSWTSNLELVISFANMPAFLHKNEEKVVYEAKIKKKDVLAYFILGEEIVVNPQKLYDVKRYEKR